MATLADHRVLRTYATFCGDWPTGLEETSPTGAPEEEEASMEVRLPEQDVIAGLPSPDATVKKDGPAAVGGDLARWLAEGLTAQGISVGGPFDQDGWAWLIVHGDEKLHVEAYVGAAVAPGRDWLIKLVVEQSFWRRMLGGAKAGAERQALLRKMALGLHNVLSTSPRVRDLRWHLASEFDVGEETHGNPTPE